MTEEPENEIRRRRKKLGLGQKALAALIAPVVERETGDTFSYQALQKIERGGKSRYMIFIMRVLEELERNAALGPTLSAAEINEVALHALAKKYETIIRLFDQLEQHRKDYILREIRSQLEKQLPDTDAEKRGLAGQQDAKGKSQ